VAGLVAAQATVPTAREHASRGAYVNALELIKSDHDRLKKLFDDALDNDEPAAREAVLHAIRSELMAHERMEEDIFYPALRSVSQVWQAKLKVLRENLDHHMEEEEGEMFKRARQALSKEALEELGGRMQQAKDAASA
jgi:hemerythrin superfamily protein